MSIRSFLQRPFTYKSLNQYAQALLAGIVLLPPIVVLLVNQNLQSPRLFFGGLLAYFVIFMAVGRRFEIKRAQKFFNKPLPAKFSFGRTFVYAWINMLLGTVLIMLTIVWAITLVRNIFIYPIAEWGHVYPDLAWGGPTWQGAMALHTGLAIVSLFIMPWILSWLVKLQMAAIFKFLVRENP